MTLFFSGVAYIVDQLRGNCSVANISDVGFDVRNADPTHVRIRSSKEFFYFDKTQYNYEGTVSFCIYFINVLTSFTVSR